MKNEERKIYCFLGLPASGKGTQVEILSKKIKAKAFGVGDLIRKEMGGADFSDPFYSKMKNDYDKGNPQPDSVVIDIIRKCIKNTTGTIIFDNFPFSSKQSVMFFEICSELGVNRPILIIVNVSKEEALARAMKRKVCSICGSIYIGENSNICTKCGGALITRADDNESTVVSRIDKYFPRIEEVKRVFSHKGKVIEINGKQSIEDVAKEISDKIVGV